MTLILALGNIDQTIMLADRRLTTDERPATTTTEEYNKLTSLVSANGRVAIGFTGRATTPEGFNTADWLLDALVEAARPKPFLQETIEELRKIATRDFAKLPGENKLTIVFAGYLYMDDGFSLPYFSWVSNFQGREWNDRSDVAQPTFSGHYFCPDRDKAESFCYVKTYGATKRLQNPTSLQDGEMIQRLLRERKPMRAIRDKGLDALNRAGASEGVLGPVGRQVGCIVVPSEPTANFIADYYSDRNRWEVELPNQVVMRGMGDDILLKGIAFGAADPTKAPPMAVRKVGRNQRCPCGSGKKYKKCHGLPLPPSITMGGTFPDST